MSPQSKKNTCGPLHFLAQILFTTKEREIKSRTKYLEKSREIQYNWTGQEKIHIYFGVLFGYYCQSLTSRKQTGYWVLSPTKFGIFRIFPNFLRSLRNPKIPKISFFSCVGTMTCPAANRSTAR